MSEMRSICRFDILLDIIFSPFSKFEPTGLGSGPDDFCDKAIAAFGNLPER